jgi:hypothetical protein
MVMTCSAELDITTNPLVAGDWVQLNLVDPFDAATPGNVLPYQINKCLFYSSCDQPLEFGVNQGAGPTPPIAIVAQISPDTDKDLYLNLAANQSVWVRSVANNTSIGQLVINFMRGKRG